MSQDSDVPERWQPCGFRQKGLAGLLGAPVEKQTQA